MGDLDCKGYTELTLGEIERIDGLTVQIKAGEEDEGLYEICGIPLDDFDAQTDYALALAEIAGKVERK
jgi:hypothetical protein